jgi:hypothetical protein
MSNKDKFIDVDIDDQLFENTCKSNQFYFSHFDELSLNKNDFNNKYKKSVVVNKVVHDKT